MVLLCMVNEFVTLEKVRPPIQYPYLTLIFSDSQLGIVGSLLPSFIRREANSGILPCQRADFNAYHFRRSRP